MQRVPRKMNLSFCKFGRAPALAASVTLLTGLLATSAAWAHGGSHGSSAGSSSSAQASASNSNDHPPPSDLHLDAHTFQPPHGGQVAATKWHYFEVVYTPHETRLYFYSPSQRALYAPSVSGEVIMQVNGNPEQFRYPLRPVIDDALIGKDMGYAVAVVDVTRVRDGDMQVTFNLKLTSREEPRVSFTQLFALTQAPVPVSVVRLTEADRPRVERQRMCPVMEDTELGAHGAPIKLLVGDRTLFVCCEGCVEEVQKSPGQYLQKAATAEANRQPPRPQVNVYWAAQADDAAIRAQGVCPVINERLGAHGRPLKVVVDGRPIFVCCEGCIDRVVRDRDLYFRSVADVRLGQGTAPLQVQQPPTQRRIAVSYATEADRPAVEVQGLCPVMRERLGGHGAPIKIAVEGQVVFVCCSDCVDHVEQNPHLYLALAKRGRQRDRYSNGSDDLYRKSRADSGGSCCPNCR
jgi:hypothetical protein